MSSLPFTGYDKKAQKKKPLAVHVTFLGRHAIVGADGDVRLKDLLLQGSDFTRLVVDTFGLPSFEKDLEVRLTPDVQDWNATVGHLVSKARLERPRGAQLPVFEFVRHKESEEDSDAAAVPNDIEGAVEWTEGEGGGKEDLEEGIEGERGGKAIHSTDISWWGSCESSPDEEGYR